MSGEFELMFEDITAYFFGRGDTPSQVQRRKEKLCVMDAYGGKCLCCKEDRFEYLTIDHIDGDGKQHRKEIKMDIYRWLRKNNYPKEGFRILCWNCHMSRAYYGYCPHAEKGPRYVLNKPRQLEVILP